MEISESCYRRWAERLSTNSSTSKISGGSIAFSSWSPTCRPLRNRENEGSSTGTLLLARNRKECKGILQVLWNLPKSREAESNHPSSPIETHINDGWAIPSSILMDCVGPLPKTRMGNKYILTLMCSATRFPEEIPLGVIST